jgi:hypothetical protein
MFSRVRKLYSNDVGIDLGTANTLVYLGGKGIVINEPSVVAVNTKTNSVVAVGRIAKEMLGKTPAHIKAIRPVLDGVVSDFEITEEMLSYHIKKANMMQTKFLGPRVVVGVPSEVNAVELKAVFDAAKSAGARKVFIVEEPMAAAIGLQLPIPQIGGMYAGDRARKETLVEFGFRLPSALDNRPLNFQEFEKMTGKILYVSATPADYEIKNGQVQVEQIIRPTGLLDPELILRPVTGNASGYDGQIKDFIREVEKTVGKGDRVLVTTLTKKMAEDLSEFLKEKSIKAEYLHSDIKTIDRITILTEFRKGTFDVLVGVNLLREGLDLPEVSLVGILDADKEGFLRSETSLIQTIGRAARNVAGRVILYADATTKSLEAAVRETNRRRTIQADYNKKHGITPQSIQKKIHDITDQMRSEHDRAVSSLIALDSEQFKTSPQTVIKEKTKEMNEAVKVLDFETAALLRDEIKALEELSAPSKGRRKTK